jgi:hypothetical protein
MAKRLKLMSPTAELAGGDTPSAVAAAPPKVRPTYLLLVLRGLEFLVVQEIREKLQVFDLVDLSLMRLRWTDL